MADTIELLEAIGQDASLRYAQTEALIKALEQMQASDALTSAVALGDHSPLCAELGPKPMQAPQSSQSPGREDTPEEEDLEEQLSIRAAGNCNAFPLN
jgi:hypothetical protein